MKQYDNYYKDSGIAWLENVPNHWDIVPYKRAVIIKNGKDYKDVQVNEGGFPVIGSGGEFAKASNYLYDGEVILMGRKGTINKPLYFKGKFWSVDTMFYCIPRKAVCGKYIYYQATIFPFNLYSTSTALPSMTQSDLCNNPIVFPPLAEQQQIAIYLDAKTEKIDKMIAKAEKKIEYLGELKQSLITRAVTRGLNPNAPLKDSGVKWIGDVPEHWEIAPLKYFTHIKTGSTPPTLNQEYYESEDINWFTPGDFESLTLKKSGKMISNKAKDDYACKIFPAGSVYIVGIGATIGKVASCSESASCNQQINVLIPIKDKIDCRYLVYCMNSQKEGILLSANMVTLPIINQTKMGQLPIPIPLYAEQQQIATYLDIKCSKIDYIIAAQKKKIAYLQELKQSLIANVVTGKIKVS